VDGPWPKRETIVSDPEHNEVSRIPQVPFNDLVRQQETVAAPVEAAVGRVLARGWYSLGPEVDQFEQQLAAYVGVPHAIGVGNGTDALAIALAAAGLRSGDEVLTAANAGGYTTSAALLQGFSVRFADLEPGTLMLDPDDVVAKITDRTKAVVVTHLYGQLGRVEELRRICTAAGVVLVEDCAQAIGATRDGQRAGSFGDVAAFSFYPTKNLGAVGDGGAVCTRDEEFARRARALRQYGWGRRYEVDMLGGRNSRLDEIQAAVLGVKLPLLDGWNARRREIADAYRAALDPEVGRLLGSGGEDDVAHLAVVVAADRDSLAARLTEHGIATAVHYPVPDHRQPAYQGLVPDATLPVTEEAARRILSLPMFPELRDDEVQRVLDALRTATVAAHT
jgi:dTDP-4-amino-4,6-dideoxygalactose transaminase